MIRYTSDPVDNVKLFLKTYAIPDKTFNFMSDATLSGANPEIEKQPGVAPYTALRLPEWDPYKVMQNSYMGPVNNQEIIDNGEGLIDVPYQTKLQQDKIASENPEKLKQIALIEQELDRLDKEEAKYNKERQAKRDYFNSDAFLSRVYQLDPNTAQFLAGRRDAQTKRDLEETKIEADKYNKSAVYTPEQKRLIDAKEQNRLEMQNVSKSARTAKIQQDKNEYERWSKAYESLKARDIELTKALAATGLTGYDIDYSDYTNFGGMETGQNPPASGIEKSNYDKAKEIVIKALAIDNQGYTTKEKKENATQNLLNYNVSLGQFPLTDKENAALENLIKNANVRGAAVDVDSEVDDLINDSPSKDVPSSLAVYRKAINAYNAAKSSFETNAIGAAIGNFLYSLRPEAVNDGDVQLAKESVRDGNQQGLKTVLDKVGMAGLLTTDYKSLASQLGQAAYKKLAEDRSTQIKKIVDLLNKYDSKKVYNRASIYYTEPVQLSSGSGSTTTKPSGQVNNYSVSKDGTIKGGYIKINGVWKKK